MKQKLAAAEAQSHVDYALWGGLVPGHLDDLEPMNEAGVVGFKAFMSSPGDEGEEAFREVDDLTLWEGMKRIARMNRVLALHAESESLVSRLGRIKQAEGAISAKDYSASRPILAELEAVNRALFDAIYGMSASFCACQQRSGGDAYCRCKRAGHECVIGDVSPLFNIDRG